MSVKWSRYGKGYEVSSDGDSRFSAFNAKMSDGRTIEMHYQCDIKGYDVGGTKWWIGKGSPPLKAGIDLWESYLNLWREWSSLNPLLMEELKYQVTQHNNLLTDKFAMTPISQARALATIINEMT